MRIKGLFFGIFILLSDALLLGSNILSGVQLPNLEWPGKRSDWIDVKTDVTPAAKGDGITDDSQAIQAALNQLMTNGPKWKPKTIYFPRGTYRITQTLILKDIMDGCWLVGHGRLTVIKWDGISGGTMLLLNGAPRCLMEGILFDGNGKGGIGLDHYSSKLFVTEGDQKYLAFKNLDMGIRFGNNGVASAEQSVNNCLFINCKTGIYIQRFNNYDILIIGSNFYYCGTGIQIGKGANGYVRTCHFEQSGVADINAIGPEHPCSFIRCTSLNSKMFLAWTGGVATAFIQDCHVSGWKSNVAMSLTGPPILIFDCVFTNPPNKNPPISASSNLVLSNNSSSQTSSLYRDDASVSLIPKGKRNGVVISASQSFFKEVVHVPQKIYDVKKFGAVGDGNADDRAAIQAAIDSARLYGKCAIVYLPHGDYKVNGSLLVSGANYTIGGVFPGGSTPGSRIKWGGNPAGIIMKVKSPKNIHIEQLTVQGDKDSIDIQQTATDPNSSITYNMVTVYGMYMKSTKKGLQFLNLTHGAKVTLDHINGNVRAINSSRARILINFNWEGVVTVEGSKEIVRDGFMGIQAKLATGVSYGIMVKDNQNLVATNFYVESADRYFSVEGNNCPVEGHVSIAGIKVQTALNPQITIDNYKGRVAGLCLQYYQAPEQREIVQTGNQPLSLIWIGNNSYSPMVIFHTTPSAKLILIENTWKGSSNRIPDGGLQKASEVLDDFREMGENDLSLNYQ